MHPAFVGDPADVRENLNSLIAQDARVLSNHLASIRQRLFPPAAQKTLRRFSSGEAATLIGISDAYLRQLSLAGEAPEPGKTSTGRRSYSLEQINEIRRMLQRSKTREYVPSRQHSEHLQILAVTNFKGGSGKTTTAAHLCQYLALRGYRVLAIDLDPQSSLSALLGYQPEMDVGENETLYAAVRYDDRRRPLREVTNRTYFAGLDVVPGNLELQVFEHETPRMLTRQRRAGEELFFMRIASAIDSIEDMYDLESLGFTQHFLSSCELEALHFIGIRSFGEEFREDVAFRGIQEEFREPLA
jgi:chromosome partitioning protein